MQAIPKPRQTPVLTLQAQPSFALMWEYLYSTSAALSHLNINMPELRVTLLSYPFIHLSPPPPLLVAMLLRGHYRSLSTALHDIARTPYLKCKVHTSLPCLLNLSTVLRKFCKNSKFPEYTVYLIYPSIHPSIRAIILRKCPKSIHWTRSDKVAVLRELAIHQRTQQDHVTATPGIEAT